ncbi:MAG TPA: hypothetical protein VGB73_00695 [Pyrinomonadaceae bacterium]|jgi:hypothetical protein
MKCLYCQRPLKGSRTYCRACQRFVFRWPHLLLLTIIGVAALLGLLELLFRVI